MDPLLLESATSLARKIREGALRSRDVVEAHITRARAVNPTLNALVAERFEAARREADAADERLQREGPGAVGPLHGVPCTIKECFALEGMPQSSGLVQRKDYRSTHDAVTVQRLRAAGAIPLGVTNVSELCMWMESFNKVYGRTSTPYDAARTCGGSSGGEGAMVGSGASPLGLGADIGGSIRMPAFFCGVFGHKPSGGLVPGSGQWPQPEEASLRMLTTGPLARRAEDLWPALRILAGPDGVDTGCRDFDLGDPAQVKLSSLRVLSVPTDGLGAPESSLLEAQRRAATHLGGLGARVREAPLPGTRWALPYWSARMHKGRGDGFCRQMGGGEREVAPGRELLRWLLRRSPHTLPAIGLGLLEKLTSEAPEQLEKNYQASLRFRDELAQLLGDDGVLLYPSHPRVAPRHYRALLPPIGWRYTAIFNMAELAVTQVPLGLDADGIPLGVQVAAAPGKDHLTIAVALELERAFGGWVPPTAL